MRRATTTRVAQGDRVEVVDDVFSEMIGRRGTVRSATQSGYVAVVEMDLPHRHSPYPRGDAKERYRKYYHDELKIVKEVEPNAATT